MSEAREVSQTRRNEPFEGWYQNALGRVSSNLHQTIAAVGLSMPVEEFIDDENHLIVRMDMPGMNPDDIQAKVRHGQLIIEGRRRHHGNGVKENLLRSEINYGRTRRRLPLPAWVESDDVELSYEDGVLELRLDTDAETCPHTSVFKPKRVMRTARGNAGSTKAESSRRPAASA